MSKKKNKFDLSYLVAQGYVKDGETVYFVSDPKKTGMVIKTMSGEFKIKANGETLTVHAFAQKCLGQEPPDHASKWFRTSAGKTLFDYWHQDDEAYAA